MRLTFGSWQEGLCWSWQGTLLASPKMSPTMVVQPDRKSLHFLQLAVLVFHDHKGCFRPFCRKITRDKLWLSNCISTVPNGSCASVEISIPPSVRFTELGV